MARGPGTLILAALLAASALAACGDDPVAVDVPGDATFCSVFLAQYADALSQAVAITDDGFGASTALIVAWAEVLASLAPDEIGAQAQDNLRYHQAQAAVASASDFIPGSNEMHVWARANCE